MLSGAGAQMVRDLVAGTGVTVREVSGWISFGALPVIAYAYDRPRWKVWLGSWATIAAGWWLAGWPSREIWMSSTTGAIWIALALCTHASVLWLRIAIHRRRGGPGRARSGFLRLLLVGWTAAILLHPSVVLYRVSRDWYDCPCQKQKLK